jgi:hypothetical protein
MPARGRSRSGPRDIEGTEMSEGPLRGASLFFHPPAIMLQSSPTASPIMLSSHAASLPRNALVNFSAEDAGNSTTHCASRFPENVIRAEISVWRPQPSPVAGQLRSSIVRKTSATAWSICLTHSSLALLSGFMARPLSSAELPCWRVDWVAQRRLHGAAGGRWRSVSAPV